ncbi:M48 family metallopeptidase [Candidatus Nitrotoga arctica]|uniref:Peptidase_M48 domain-containing protein n=1 Tax=Candidatus Nitrotoga arctica TaxID=453162 RepID=A0ABM8YZ14_9PROT|nr:M48 family metallopeptidase [Candidatus Nitrotoga arctica]CAG9932826.1 Peptidase_M48 domain-containing protein [Candidatus Nitrotoga arctica]
MAELNKIVGLAWGPGFQSTGSPVEVSISNYGLQLTTQDDYDGTPAWRDISVRKGGFNDSQVMIEWQGRAGSYMLTVSDISSVATLRVQLKTAPQNKENIKTAGAKIQDRATRIWSNAFIWGIFVLPMLVLVAIVWEHERLTTWAISHVTVTQERKWGEQIFALTKQHLTLVKGPGATMVREIGTRLSQGSAYQYEFYVADDASVNAFAMPGGFIVINTGLLALADNAEQVAGVIAHEIQHVEKRHSLNGMVKSAGLMVTASMVFGDLSGVASLGSALIKYKFSRQHEAEADIEGLKALVVSGISPIGMRDFFRKMSQKETLNLEWFSSHPASNDRFMSLDTAIKALLPATVAAKPLPYDYTVIKAVLLK